MVASPSSLKGAKADVEYFDGYHQPTAAEYSRNVNAKCVNPSALEETTAM